MIRWLVFIDGEHRGVAEYPTYRQAWKDARSHWSQLHSSRFRIERAA